VEMRSHKSLINGEHIKDGTRRQVWTTGQCDQIGGAIFPALFNGFVLN
jgi:hypothetical protein